MPEYSRYYILGAFVLGVAVTTIWKSKVSDEAFEYNYLKKGSNQIRRDASKIRDRRRSIWSLIELVDSAPAPVEKREDIKEGIEGCIGNTPLIRIKSLSEATGCEILAKAEFLNGAGNSPKDRVALSIIQTAEEDGILVPYSGDTIYEGTVGSTGISLAAICRARGYKAHICMPNDMAVEKSDLLLKLGAGVERVRPAPIVDQNQFVNLARTRAAEHTASPDKPGNGLFADQFETEANWRAHFNGTGPEIYSQTGGKLDAFVSGAGTGGTISGVALFLKERLPLLQVVLADPPGSGLYNRVKFGVMFDPKEREGTRRRHQVDTIVEGIGINRVTQNFEIGRELVDDAIRVNDQQAKAMARWLVEKDGIFVGSSSAVNCKSFVQSTPLPPSNE
jgi:cysteine synthase